MHHDLPNNKPVSHYENIVLKKDENALVQHAKLKVFNYMNQLEGWCSKNKASILMDLVFMLKPKVIVEIGVWGGKSLIPMAYALKVNGKGKAYGIDPWDSIESIKGMEGINYDWWNRVDHEMILQGLLTKITQFDLEEYLELIRTTSEFAPRIPDIDILHIDGNHSKKASELDIQWVELVKRGGVIIWDDLTWGSLCAEGTEDSNENAVKWMNENCIKFAEYHDQENSWGIWIKP
jgi:predicted O-methyltransferase YrrM